MAGNPEATDAASEKGVTALSTAAAPAVVQVAPSPIKRTALAPLQVDTMTMVPCALHSPSTQPHTTPKGSLRNTGAACNSTPKGGAVNTGTSPSPTPPRISFLASSHSGPDSNIPDAATGAGDSSKVVSDDVEKSSSGAGRQHRASVDHKKHASWAPEQPTVEGEPRPPSRSNMGSRTMSRKLQSQGRASARHLSNQASLHSSKGRHHHTVMDIDMLDGSRMTINKAWLLEWLEELRHLPEGLRTDAMDTVLSSISWDVQPDQVHALLLCLPSREVLRFRQMADTTMRVAAATASALNQDYVEFAVEHTFHRIQAQIQGRWVATPPSDKGSSTTTPPETPGFMFLLDQFDKQVEAAKKIQRAFRSFKARCDRLGCWPSGGAPGQEDNAPSTRSRYMDVYRHDKHHKGKQELQKMFTVKLMDKMRSRASQAGSSRTASPLPTMTEEQMQALAEEQAEKLARQAIRDRKIARRSARRQAEALAKEQAREARREVRRAARQQVKEVTVRTKIAHAQLRKIDSLREQFEEAIQRAAAEAMPDTAEDVAKAMGVTVTTAQDVMAAAADAAALTGAAPAGAATADAGGAVNSGQQQKGGAGDGLQTDQGQGTSNAGDTANTGATIRTDSTDATAGDGTMNALPADSSAQQPAVDAATADGAEPLSEPLSSQLTTSTGMDPALAATVTKLTAQTSSAAVLLAEPSVAGLNVRKLDSERSSLAGSIAAQPSLAALLIKDIPQAGATGPSSPIGLTSLLLSEGTLSPTEAMADMWAGVTDEALAAMGTTSAGILLDRLEKAAKQDLAALKPKRGRRNLTVSTGGSTSFAAPRVASLNGAASIKSVASAGPTSPTCPASPTGMKSPGGQGYLSSPSSRGNSRGSSVAGFAASPSSRFRQSIASFGPASPGVNKHTPSSRFASTSGVAWKDDTGRQALSVNGAPVVAGIEVTGRGTSSNGAVLAAAAAGTAGSGRVGHSSTPSRNMGRSPSPTRSDSPTRRSNSPTRMQAATPAPLLESPEERLARWEALMQQKELFADYLSSSEEEDSDSTMSSELSTSSSSSSSVSTVGSSDSEPDTEHTDHTDHTDHTEQGTEEGQDEWSARRAVLKHLPTFMEFTTARSPNSKKLEGLATLTQETDTMRKAVMVGQTMLDNSEHFYNCGIVRSGPGSPERETRHGDGSGAHAQHAAQDPSEEGVLLPKSPSANDSSAAAGGTPHAHAEYLQSGSALLHHMMFHEGLELIGDVARTQSPEQLRTVLQAQVDKVVDKRMASARRRVGLKLPEPEVNSDAAAQQHSARSRRSSGNPLTARSRRSTQESLKDGPGPLSVQGSAFEGMQAAEEEEEGLLGAQSRRRTVDDLRGSAKSMKALEAVSGDAEVQEDGPALQPWGTGVRYDLLTPPAEKPLPIATHRPPHFVVSDGAVHSSTETASVASPMLTLRQQRRHADKGSTLGRASVSRCKLQRDPLSPGSVYSPSMQQYQPPYGRSPHRHLFDNSDPEVARMRMAQLSEQILSLQQQQLFLDSKSPAGYHGALQAGGTQREVRGAMQSPGLGLAMEGSQVHLNQHGHITQQHQLAVPGITDALALGLQDMEADTAVQAAAGTAGAGTDDSNMVMQACGSPTDALYASSSIAQSESSLLQPHMVPENAQSTAQQQHQLANGTALRAVESQACLAPASANADMHLQPLSGALQQVTGGRGDTAYDAAALAAATSMGAICHHSTLPEQQPGIPLGSGTGQAHGPRAMIPAKFSANSQHSTLSASEQAPEQDGRSGGQRQGNGQAPGRDQHLGGQVERQEQEQQQQGQEQHDLKPGLPATAAIPSTSVAPTQPGVRVALHRATGNNPEITRQLFLAKARQHMEQREGGLPISYTVRPIRSMGEAAGYLAAPQLAAALAAGSGAHGSIAYHQGTGIGYSYSDQDCVNGVNHHDAYSLSPIRHSRGLLSSWERPSLPVGMQMPFSSLQQESSHQQGSEGSGSGLSGPELSFSPSPALGPSASQGSHGSSQGTLPSLTQHPSSSYSSPQHVLSPRSSRDREQAITQPELTRTETASQQGVDAGKIMDALNGLHSQHDRKDGDAQGPVLQAGSTTSAVAASLPQLDLDLATGLACGEHVLASVAGVQEAERKRHKRHRHGHRRNHGSEADGAAASSGQPEGLKLPKIAGGRSPRDAAAGSAYVQSWLAATTPATQTHEEPVRRAAPVVHMTLPLLGGSPDARSYVGGHPHVHGKRQHGGKTAGMLIGGMPAGVLPAGMLPDASIGSERDMMMGATVAAYWDSMMQAIAQGSKPVPHWLNSDLTLQNQS